MQTQTVSNIKSAAEIKPTSAPIPTPTPARKTEREEEKPIKEEIPDYIIAGEVFNCYVIVQLEDRILMIDKHAAHERILFDEMCQRMKSKAKHSQILMLPLNIPLSEEELVALEEYGEQIKSLGFVYRVEKEKKRVSVTEIPDELAREAASDMICELATQLSEGTGSVEAAEAKFFEAKLYQASCKAAIKAGRVYPEGYAEWLIRELRANPEVICCPHGRPIAIEITKNTKAAVINLLINIC